MEPWLRKALIVMGFFVLIVPVGILATWNYGDAWGEWGEINDVQHGISWTPKSFFNAPLPDYNLPLPGWDENKVLASIGYWISAIVGILMCFLVSLGVVKAIEIAKST